MIRWFKVPLRRRLVAASLVSASLVVGLVLTVLSRSSPIPVGLDISAPASAPPLLTWTNPEGGSVAFDGTPPEFSPLRTTIKLLPIGDKNPDSTGHDVWVAMHPRFEKVYGDQFERRFHPFELGQRYLWYNINSNASGAPFQWKASSETPSPVFLKTPASGQIRFATGTGIQTYDLYSPTPELFTPPRSDLLLTRYFVTVPLKVLAGMQLVFPSGDPIEIHRLYIGTFFPSIYFGADKAYPEYSHSGIFGFVHTNWEPKINENIVYLPSVSRWLRGGMLTFVAISIAVFTMLIAGVLILIAVARILSSTKTSSPQPSLRPLSTKTFFTFFASFLAIYLLYLSFTYPGVMTNDSVMQWEQAHTLELTNHHPATHTFMLSLIISIWDSPAAVAVVQVVFMSLTLAYAYCLLLRIDASRFVVFLLFHASLLSVRNGIFSVTLWKDIPYSVAVLLLSALLLRMLYSRSDKRDVLHWALLGLVLASLPMFRHNGVLCLWALAVVAPLFYDKYRRRVFLLVAVFPFLLYYGYSAALRSTFDIPKAGSFLPTFMTMKSAILVDQDVPLHKSDYEFLNKVRDINPDKWAYHRATSGPTVRGLNHPFVDDNISEYTQRFQHLSKQYPLLMLQDHLNRTQFIFADPFHTYLSLYYVGRLENPKSVRDKGYENHPSFPVLEKEVSDVFSALPKGVWFFYRPSTHLYIVLAALLVTIIRMRDWRYLIVFLPVLINTLSIMIVPIAEDVRYQFPLTLSSGFLICVAFIPKRPTA